MSAILYGKSLHLTGEVGDFGAWGDGDCFAAIDVLMALSPLDAGDDITVHLNSPGGLASEGAAIYAMLSARTGAVSIIVEGIAASAASLIAMAGDMVTMAPGSVMMIHDPSGFTAGNSDAHGKTIEALEALANTYATVYARKSGQSVAQCRSIMKAETWFTPEEAVKAGFADLVGDDEKPLAFAAFDYGRFQNAPQQLVALARDKNWSGSAKTTPTNKSRKETTMSKDNAGAHATATARIKAIMKADAAAGRTELAEHLAYETQLSPDEAIAVMSAAPKGNGEKDSADEWRPRHRMNAQGLNNASRDPSASATGSNLVAAMKRRHGKS